MLSIKYPSICTSHPVLVYPAPAVHRITARRVYQMGAVNWQAKGPWRNSTHFWFMTCQNTNQIFHFHPEATLTADLHCQRELCSCFWERCAWLPAPCRATTGEVGFLNNTLNFCWEMVQRQAGQMQGQLADHITLGVFIFSLSSLLDSPTPPSTKGLSLNSSLIMNSSLGMAWYKKIESKPCKCHPTLPPYRFCTGLFRGRGLHAREPIWTKMYDAWPFSLITSNALITVHGF